MLLAHGTTERNANQIYDTGYFHVPTYFIKLEPDPKLAIYGTAGFALRHNPESWKYVDLYCKHDLIIRPLKRQLIKEAQSYLKQKKDDDTLGLIFVVDAEDSILDYYKDPIRQIFIPSERFSTEKIYTNSINYIVTLMENKKYFEEKYNIPAKAIEDLTPDDIIYRIFNTVYARWLRTVQRKK